MELNSASASAVCSMLPARRSIAFSKMTPEPVDKIGSGPSREPRRWRRGRGSWARRGLLGVSPRNGYYQLGFWTGAGPSGTFTPA
jgi:hypothetical protein